MDSDENSGGLFFGHVDADEDFSGPPIPIAATAAATGAANGAATGGPSWGAAGVAKRQEVLLPEQATLIRESYARIEQDRKQHALIMYLTIFDICPEAKPLFSMVRDSKEPAPVNPRLEAHASLAFTMMCEAFSKWDDPDQVAKATPFFKALGGRHLNYGIDGEDFPIFRTGFMKALQRAFGEEWIFRTGFMKALQRAFGEEWFGDLEGAWCAAFDILESMASSGMAEKGGKKVIPPAALEILEKQQQQL
ncbi:hypothetical protein CLOP_g12121 [Closterium sp. NIES-67]|nr:hypothetical protein CLOP_g12121 [Closterium sp. NIES-67]